jgi:hypothetical protein
MGYVALMRDMRAYNFLIENLERKKPPKETVFEGGPVAVCCEHSNDTSGVVKDRTFLDCLNHHQLFLEKLCAV